MRSILFSTCVAGLCLLMSGCGKMASQYDHLVSQYKQELCLAYRTRVADEKAKAVERVAQLTKDYETALTGLSATEQAKLSLKWSMAQADASQGKCD